MLSNAFKDIQHGLLVNTAETGARPNADTLAKLVNDLRGPVRINPHAVQRLRFRKGLAALQTLIPLNDPVFILKTTKLLCFIT
jgi:hypothetical protein